MRNGTKIRQLLSVCDVFVTMDEDGKITIITTSKSGLGTRRKEGATWSAALDKAHRQMMKDAVGGFDGEE